MKTAQKVHNSDNPLNHRGRRLIGLIAAASALLAVGPVFADDGVSMAPPVNGDVTYSNDGVDSSAAADSVFNWREVPEDQRVPIERATFDQGGYQLYDDAGETIVVPFTNDNLYVMKFAVSSDGKTYFINSGDAPVLYLPRNGFLVNAAVAGARWYPFSDGFRPSSPVFLGIAPSWDDYCNMGWYPSMYCYGGYWGRTSYINAGIFLPTIGLVFVIDGHHFHGWEPYHHYYNDIDRSWHHITIVNRNVYRYGSRPDRDNRTFRGGGNHNTRYYDNNGGSHGRFDNGGSHGRFDSSSSHGQFDNGGRVFRGAGHPFPVNRGGGDHSFPSDHGANHQFPSGGDSSAQHDRSRSFHGVSGGQSFPSGGSTTEQRHDSPNQGHRGGPIGGGITVGPTSRSDNGHAFPSGGDTSSSSRDNRSFRGADNNRSFHVDSQPFPSAGRASDRGGSHPFPGASSAPREAPRSAPMPTASPRDSGGDRSRSPRVSNDSPRNNSDNSNNSNWPGDQGGRGGRGHR